MCENGGLSATTWTTWTQSQNNNLDRESISRLIATIHRLCKLEFTVFVGK